MKKLATTLLERHLVKCIFFAGVAVYLVLVGLTRSACPVCAAVSCATRGPVSAEDLRALSR